jgi:anti-sigma regulatory factor (Ser/Thr protein kinase)
MSSVRDQGPREPDTDDRETAETGSVSRQVMLPDSLHAPRLARRAVSGLLACAGVERRAGADLAILLTSEVVTNAIRHAAPAERGSRQIRLVVRIAAGLLRVQVYDPDPSVPALPTPDAYAEHGRGLLLLAAQAKEWGVRVLPNHLGKSIWFTCALD